MLIKIGKLLIVNYFIYMYILKPIRNIIIIIKNLQKLQN